MPPFPYIWMKHDQFMRISLKLVACVLSALPLLSLRIPVSYAQQPSGWLHPDLSMLAYATGIYDADAGQGRLSTRAAVSATFGRGSNTEASVSYDLIDKKLMGCELLWTPVRALRVRAGIQRMPFLLETSYSPRTLEAVGFSQAASYLGGYSRDLSGRNSRSRDTGVTVEGLFLPRDGGYNVISAVAGLFIGNGYSFEDDNDAKDFHGRLVIQPSRHWKVSAGAMLGRYGEEELVRNRFSTGLWYDDGRWFVRSENIYGVTDGLRSDGFAALGGCWFTGRMALSARYDRFQTDLSDPLTATTQTQACFTHMLSADRGFSYRLQYGHAFRSDPSVPDSNTLSCSLIMRFGARL